MTPITMIKIVAYDANNNDKNSSNDNIAIMVIK